MTDSDSEPMSVLAWFLRRARTQANQTALWLLGESVARGISWGQWEADVFRAAAALCRLGVGVGDRVAQLCENRYEWLVTDLALQCVQAIHVPLHAQLPAGQVAAAVRHSGARVVLLSTAAQLEKITAAAAGLRCADGPTSGPLCCLVYDDLPAALPSLDGISAGSWWHELSATDPGRGQALARGALGQARPGDIVKILYTSGTTGEPKGVMLTAANLLFNAQRIAVAYGPRPPDRLLNFLPLSHVFAQTNDVNAALVAGNELALARSRETIVRDCQTIKPTFLNGVPAFYERVWRQLVDAGRQDEPGALRELLGGRLELCNAGGAPLSEDLFSGFERQGIPLLQGYGLTETSPVICVSTPQANRRGCVGRPLPGVDVRITADGEIATRGPHVMAGYYRDPEATAEAIREGWFYTGDLGQVDPDGFVRVTGRKKELIVLSNGFKVVPSDVERVLSADPLILQVAVFAPDQRTLTALVVPDCDRLAREFGGRTVVAAELRQRVSRNDPDVVRWMAERMRRFDAELAPWQRVRRIALVWPPWTVEAGQLTAKLSLRRPVIAARYADLLRTPGEPSGRA